MVNITFEPKNFTLEVTGHAGQDEKGHDIVCSALSMLFYTLAQSVTMSERMLKEEPVIRFDDGNGYIQCTPKEEYIGNISLVHWTIMNGFELLVEEYPQYISFRVKEK